MNRSSGENTPVATSSHRTLGAAKAGGELRSFPFDLDPAGRIHGQIDGFGAGWDSC
jgi:hypothetical protein